VSPSSRIALGTFEFYILPVRDCFGLAAYITIFEIIVMRSTVRSMYVFDNSNRTSVVGLRGGRCWSKWQWLEHEKNHF